MAVRDADSFRSIRADYGGVAAHHIGHVEIHAPSRRQVRWPLLIGRAPAQAECFQPRATSDFMSRAAPRDACLVLTGPGGVGKTQIAAHRARVAWENAAVDLLIWVTAVSRDAILAAYAQAAIAVAASDSADIEQAAAALLSWLATTDRRWLMVLDDLSDPADLRDLWPPARSDGTILVTTRRRDSALRGPGRQVAEVGLFDAAQAIAYLTDKLTSRGQDADTQQLAALAEDLGFLPLALAQATAYIVDLGLDVPAYRRRLADARRTLPDVFPDSSGLPDDHRSTLEATWSLSVEHANQLRPTNLAQPMLELASLLDPNGIPEAVITSWPVLRFLTASNGGPDSGPGLLEVDVDDASDALRCLHRLSLIEHTPSSGSREVRVHSLTQRATREKLAEDRRQHLVQTAADALYESWPKIERDTALTQSLRANARALISWAGDLLWRPRAHKVLFRLGRSLSEAGLVSSALAYWTELYQLSNRLLGADHPDTLLTRNNVARRQAQAGDLAAAVMALRSLVADMVRVLGADHPHTLATRASLATRLAEAGDPLAGVLALEVVVADMIRALGSDHAQTLTARNNLAYLGAQTGWPLPGRMYHGSPRPVAAPIVPGTSYRATPEHASQLGRQGDAAGAMQIYEEIISDYTRQLGADHPQTLNARACAAHWRGKSGDEHGAAAAFEKLAQDYARVLGEGHSETLSVLESLHHWRTECGDETCAAATSQLINHHLQTGSYAPQSDAISRRDARNEADHAKARTETLARLAEQTRGLGPYHRTTLATRASLAHETGLAGDPSAAAAAYEQLMADCMRVLGGDHADALAVRANLAYWRGRAGDPAKAALELEELLASQLRLAQAEADRMPRIESLGRLGRWRVPSASHTSYGTTTTRISTVTTTTSLLTGLLSVLGLDHLDTLSTRQNLAHWRSRAGDPAGAAAAAAELLEDQIRILGHLHPSTLTTRNNLARWRGEAGDAAEAAALTNRVLADYLRVYGADHPYTLAIRNNLAHWLGESGDPSAAVTAYETLTADSKRILGPEHSSTLNARNNLARWRGEAGDPAAAHSAFESLLTDCLLLLGPEHDTTLTIRGNLAHWAGESGDVEGACAQYTDLLADCTRVRGSAHPHTRAIRMRLERWRRAAGMAATPLVQHAEYLTNYMAITSLPPEALWSPTPLARDENP